MQAIVDFQGLQRIPVPVSDVFGDRIIRISP
jgi:hypothetical protein